MAIDISKSGWGSDLNNFIETNSISDTGWTNSGITMLNGFKMDSINPLSYRILTFGTVKMVCINGYISGGTIAANGKVNVAQFPDVVIKAYGLPTIGGANVKSATGLFQLNTDGTLDLVLYNGDSLDAGSGTWVNMLMITSKQ
ncbi:hypothetical protein FC26_GL000842 [Paucilactobacillus vaccinostercus DSM 20634]|uniref:Uncharacterized protein n=1 Tax=Paucilactobacillus vaccinostercus DSM 20634 TaxID=1423813 RepID=A0A0R2A3T6_9LACO|nr:hypothetical protein [Paucilactobacillus vaccinostercus]KRM62110.1 hypothetical protein FC26_GL000842 [Paucilactobacillus vaccinostercus DSM 20634]